MSLSLLLLALVSGANDAVLWEFSSTRCGPCQVMEPTVRRLVADGYAVRQVDVDRDPQAASQFRVSSIPCFVLVAGGREVERLVGATSYDRLVRMFPPDARNVALAAAPHRVAAPPTETTRYRDAFAALNRALERHEPARTADTRARLAAAAAPAVAGAPPAENAERRAIQATVRLRVADARGYSVGTGTVIDRHGDEVLVLTCGHLFRDSQGQGRITADLFAAGDGSRTVSGQLITYESEQRDIALVSLRPVSDIAPAPVATTGVAPRVGEAVFSVGCDRGAEPSVRVSRITAVNKYLGAANFVVAGQPVDGRSGGGLFDSAGRLIGVCNAADPQDDEGLFAALPVVHWQLAQIGLQGLFEPGRSQLAANAPARDERLSTTNANFEPSRAAPRNDAEVICIVRSRAAQGGSEVLVVEQPSADLVERLRRESKAASSSPHVVSASPPSLENPHRGGTILRAQSRDGEGRIR